MASIMRIVHEDARGGPYVRIYLDDKFVTGWPSNPGDQITVLYDARDNRVTS